MSSNKREREKRAALARRDKADPAGTTRPGGVIAGLEMQMRSGPLPDPATLAEYEAIVPGTAKLIVEKFAAQSDHRRDMESVVIRGNDRRADRGQWMALAITVVAIGAGGLLAWYGKQTAGLATIISALGSVVAVFIVGKIRQGKDAAARRES